MTQELEIIEIEADLTPAKMKDWVNGEDGEIIRLVDIEHTKEKLSKMAEKYQTLVITKDNYKKEGAEAERSLRDTRYLLQNVHKKNNKYLNEVKRQEKEVFDSLISVIQVVEDRLKGEISAIENVVKKEKEEKEKAEELRKKKIEDNLAEWELNLGKMLGAIKNDEQLLEFDNSLNDLKDSFETFEEFEFKAKRLHAVFTGRRSEAVNVIEEAKKLEEDKKKIEEEKAQLAAKKDKILNFRISQLKARGFEDNMMDHPSVMNESIDEYFKAERILAADEVDWTVILDEIDVKIKESQVNKDEEAKKAVIDAKKKWNDLIDVFKGFGGDIKVWKLKKDEVPTDKDIEKLKVATEHLQAQKRLLKLQGVRNEIEPLQNEFLDFIAGFEKRVKEVEFKNPESKTILENLINRFEDVVNEVLGEVN